MPQDGQGIRGEFLPASLNPVGELNIPGRVGQRPAEDRQLRISPERNKRAAFSCIAVLPCTGDAVSFVREHRDAAVERLILRRKVIIVPVIRIEVLHLTGQHRRLDQRGAALGLEEALKREAANA